MSVCVNIRTAKQLEPKQIFDELVHRGQRIVITLPEFPCVKMGTAHEALRGIEIYQEENGYEVRICSFANRSDLLLYAVVVDAIKAISEGKTFYEDDDEQEITNPKEYFDEEWIKEQLESSFNINTILVKHFGKPVIMDGLFIPFCLGPHLFKVFDIDMANPNIERLQSLQDYLVTLQWRFSDSENTSTRLALPDPNDEDGNALSVSLIYAENGNVKDFDYVSYADVLCLMDKDEDLVMIRMEDFPKIIPPQGFVFIDDYQFAKEGELSYETFKQMQNHARLYQVDDLFYHPTFPGNGYDEKQKTFALMWNPAISSVKMEDHLNDISNLFTGVFSWSVYDYKKAKKDDRFVMVRCGDGKTGIVMSGVFASNPYQAGDWRGKGRKVFYMEMAPNFIADPEKAEILTTEVLQKVIPSFDWSGGHSGRMLVEDQARQLEELLSDYLALFCNNVDGKTVNGFSLPQNDYISPEDDEDK